MLLSAHRVHAEWERRCELDKEKIASNLIKLRGKRKQSEIASILEIAQSTYAMYESGKRMPSDAVKVKIAKLDKKTVQSIIFN